MSSNKNFYAMSKGDLFTLVGLLSFAVITFLCLKATATISGLAIFGWLMGLFMFIAPIISLVSIKFDDNNKQRNDKAVIKN